MSRPVGLERASTGRWRIVYDTDHKKSVDEYVSKYIDQLRNGLEHAATSFECFEMPISARKAREAIEPPRRGVTWRR